MELKKIFALFFFPILAFADPTHRPAFLKKIETRIAELLSVETGVPLDRIDVIFDPYNPPKQYLAISPTEYQKDRQLIHAQADSNADLRMQVFASEQFLRDVKHDGNLKGALLHEFYHEISTGKLQALVEKDQEKLAQRFGMTQINREFFVRIVRNGIQFAASKGVETYSDFMAQAHLLRKGEHPDSMIDLIQELPERGTRGISDYVSKTHLPKAERISALQAHRTFLQKDRSVFPVERLHVPKSTSVVTELRNALSTEEYLNAVKKDFENKLKQIRRAQQKLIRQNRAKLYYDTVAKHLVTFHLDPPLPFDQGLHEYAQRKISEEIEKLQQWSKRQFSRGLIEARNELEKTRAAILLNTWGVIQSEGFFNSKSGDEPRWHLISMADYNELTAQALRLIKVTGEKKLNDILASGDSMKIAQEFARLLYDHEDRIKGILLEFKETNPQLFLEILSRSIYVDFDKKFHGPSFFREAATRTGFITEILQEHPHFSFTLLNEIYLVWEGKSMDKDAFPDHRTPPSMDALKSAIEESWKQPIALPAFRPDQLLSTILKLGLKIPTWLQEELSTALQRSFMNPEELANADYTSLLRSYAAYPELRKSIEPALSYGIQTLTVADLKQAPTLAHFEAELLEAYVLQPELLSAFPGVSERISHVLKIVKQFETYFLDLSDEKFIEQITRSIKGLEARYGTARRNHLKGSQARRVVHASLFALARIDLHKIFPLDKDPDQTRETQAAQREVLSMMLVRGEQFPEILKRVKALRRSILIQLFARYESFGTSRAALRLFRSLWKSKEDLKSAVMDSILRVPEKIGVEALSQLMDIEITAQDLFERPETKHLTSVEIKRIYNAIQYQIKIDEMLFLEQLLIRAGEDLSANRISPAEFMAVVFETTRQKATPYRILVSKRLNEILRNYLHEKIAKDGAHQALSALYAILIEKNHVFKPGEVFSKGAYDSVGKTLIKFALNAIEHLSHSERMIEAKRWTLKMGEWGLQASFFRSGIAQLFLSSILQSDPSIEMEEKIHAIGSMNHHLTTEQLHRAWDVLAEQLLYQSSYSEDAAASLLKGIYRDYYDGIAFKMNEVANRFLLQEAQILALRRRLFDHDVQAGLYLTIELIRGAIVVNLREPGAHIELIEWLLGRGETPPAMAVDIVTAIRNYADQRRSDGLKARLIAQYSRSEKATLLRIAENFTLERLREVYRDSPAVGRGLILSELINSNQPQGLMATRKGRAMTERYLLKSFQGKYKSIASTIMSAYLKALGEEAHLFVTLAIASQDPKDGFHEEDSSSPREAMQLKKIGEVKGSLWIKILQILYGDRGLIPDDRFRETFRSMLDKAAEPFREEIFSMLRKELGTEYEKIKFVGAIVGAGSINVNIIVEMQDGSIHVIKLIKGNPENIADHELIVIRKMIANLRAEAASATQHARLNNDILKAANALEEYVIAIGEKMKAEVDFRIERRLAKELTPSYTRYFPDLNVEIALLRESPSQLVYGKDHANAERVILYPFIKDQKNELSATEKHRMHRAILITELEAIFKFRKYDPDGHIGNWLNPWTAEKKQGKLTLFRIDFSQGEVIDAEKLHAFQILLNYALHRKYRLIRILPGIKAISTEEAANAYLKIIETNVSAHESIRIFKETVTLLLERTDSINPVTIVSEIHGAVKERLGNSIFLHPQIRMVVKALGALQQLVDVHNSREMNFATQEFLRIALGWNKATAKLATLARHAKMSFHTPRIEMPRPSEPGRLYDEIIKDKTGTKLTAPDFDYLKEIYANHPGSREDILKLFAKHLKANARVFDQDRFSENDAEIDRFQRQVFTFIIEEHANSNAFLSEALLTNNGLSWLAVNHILGSENSTLEALLLNALDKNVKLSPMISKFPIIRAEFIAALHHQVKTTSSTRTFECIAPIAHLLGKSFLLIAAEALKKVSSSQELILYFTPSVHVWWSPELDNIVSQKLFAIAETEKSEQRESLETLKLLHQAARPEFYSRIQRPIDLFNLVQHFESKVKTSQTGYYKPFIRINDVANHQETKLANGYLLVETTDRFELYQEGVSVWRLPTNDPFARYLAAQSRDKNRDLNAITHLLSLLSTTRGRIDAFLAKEFSAGYTSFNYGLSLGVLLNQEDAEYLQRRVEKENFPIETLHRLHAVINEQISFSERGTELERTLIDLNYLCRNRSKQDSNIHLERGKTPAERNPSFWDLLEEILRNSPVKPDFSKIDLFQKYPLSINDVKHLPSRLSMMRARYRLRILPLLPHLSFQNVEAFQLFDETITHELGFSGEQHDGILSHEPDFEKQLIHQKLEVLRRKYANRCNLILS